MASSDIYVRKDVYEADQRALIAELRLMHNELLMKIDEKFDAFKKEVDKKFEAVDKKFDSFRNEVNQKFEGVNQKFEGVNIRFERLERKIEVLTTRVEGVEQRISDTHNFMMIGFAILGLMIAFVPIARFIKRWWRRPVITAKKVEEMINAKLDVFNQNKTSPLP